MINHQLVDFDGDRWQCSELPPELLLFHVGRVRHPAAGVTSLPACPGWRRCCEQSSHRSSAW
jgi:hypothetical protein